MKSDFICPDCKLPAYGMLYEKEGYLVCNDCYVVHVECVACQGEYRQEDLYSNGWCHECLTEVDKSHLYRHEFTRSMLRIA